MMNLNDVLKILEDNKLKNISVYTDLVETEERFIIIASSSNVQQSKNVADILAEKFNYQEKIEGYSKGEWIVFDFNTILVHIFLPKVREKYNLDKLYKPMKNNKKKK